MRSAAIGAALVGGVVLVLSSASCRSSVALGDSETSLDAAAPPLVADSAPPAVDANAFRPLCPATTCPAPYATCSDDSFRCETNFDSDDTSCGACGVNCPSGEAIRDVLGAEFHCQSGECRMACAADTAKHTGDCNHDVADGCEIDLDCDANNCGACGVTCPAGSPCVGGNCGCPAGLSLCGPATCGASCLDLRLDDLNCGMCGNECPQSTAPPAPNMHLGCDSSICGAPKCDQGFGNCNGSATDGCEADLTTDTNNCNACGIKCAAGQVCENGKCSCTASETRCHGSFGDFTYCANLDTSAQDCGACGNQCPFADYPSKTVCRLGRCELQCPQGYADCDGNLTNGCETLVNADPRNCGACGVRCDLSLGQPCVEGMCLLAPCEEGPTK